MLPVTRRSFVASSVAFSFARRLFAAGAAPGKVDGFRRAAALNRGVNLSGWFGGWGDLTAEHLATYTTPADLAFIHAAGLRYVRLCVDPAPLTAGGFDGPDAVAMFARLDQAIHDILSAGLALSITLFPHDDYKKALLTPDGVKAFTGLWRYLAAHYAPLDPERVFFDLMNEPQINDAAAWNTIQASAVDAIRSVNTTHTIIATGCRYSGIDELLQVKPVHDENTVYTFHFYEPFPFTHQGSTWSSAGLAKLKDVPYPGDPEVLGPMVANISDPGARAQLAQYASEGWDAAYMLRRIRKARAWADAHRVPVICNEFGAFRDTISPEHRAVYLRDVRTTLESLHIPWAEWDYRGNFGIVSKAADGTITPDAPILEALGLTVPAAIAPATAALP